ncbi:hypothetical protein HYW46_01865 [Candidatus Daviesbacteria bacterium]|nr:hypothetical protein [Candidatus Daviesbacteria bacterium]
MVNLEQELKQSYEMIRERFNVKFDLPKLILGDPYKMGHITIRGLHDLGKRPPMAVFRDKTYAIEAPG